MSRRDDDGVPLGAKAAASTVLGLLVVVGAGWVGLHAYAGDRTPRNAQVEGIDIAGLSPADAEARLQAGLATRVAQPIEVTYGDGRTRSVVPAAAGLAVDYHASVVAAGGGGGWAPSRLWQIVTGGGDEHAVVTVDDAKMQATLDSLSLGIGQPPVEGTIVFRDGQATGVPGRDGLGVARGAAQAMLEARFLHGGSQKLPTQVQQPVVTADEVNQALGRFGRPAMSGPVHIVLAGHRIVATPQLLARALSMRVDGGRLVPQVDGQLLVSALTAAGGLDPRPHDATVTIRRGRPVVVAARAGTALDAGELEAALPAVLTRTGEARRLVVRGTTTQPALSTASVRRLGVRGLVSRVTTAYSFAAGRNANLARGVGLLDGTLLRPGQALSLDGVLGARTAAHGYTGGFEATPGSFGDDRDGGLSTLATSTFGAGFFAGLDVTQRQAPTVHTPGDPVGLDAVVTPPADLRLTDDTASGVLVTASMVPATPGRAGSVTVAMWSTRHWVVSARTGRRTDVSAPGVQQAQAAGCRPSPGVPGFGVDVVRVFRAVGSPAVVRTETFHSDYVARDEVRCRPLPPRHRHRR